MNKWNTDETEGTGIQTTLEAVKENEPKMESVRKQRNVKHYRNIMKLRQTSNKLNIFKLG